MGVVSSHGYGVLVVVRVGGRGWYSCRTKPEGLVACLEMPENFPRSKRYTDDTCTGVQLWVGSSQNWLVFLERS